MSNLRNPSGLGSQLVCLAANCFFSLHFACHRLLRSGAATVCLRHLSLAFYVLEVAWAETVFLLCLGGICSGQDWLNPFFAIKALYFTLAAGVVCYYPSHS